MKNIIITGSTRGIGRCMAIEFMKAGCNVTISGRGESIPDDTANELKEFKNRYIYVQCNVHSISDIENLWNQSAQKWGRIDIWINNAGQNCPHEFIYNTEAPYVEKLIDTNIKGMVYGSQVAAKNMLKQGGGRIYNMEGLGSNDMIQVKTILYGTSKRALTYFTRALAKELEGTPVKAGRLSPGMMLTDFLTKTPDGEASPVLNDSKFQFIFNTLGDKPETVAKFFIPKMLSDTKNDSHIEWLTTRKSFARFLSVPFKKRKLI